jgi:hypothetical protein
LEFYFLPNNCKLHNNCFDKCTNMRQHGEYNKKKINSGFVHSKTLSFHKPDILCRSSEQVVCRLTNIHWQLLPPHRFGCSIGMAFLQVCIFCCWFSNFNDTNIFSSSNKTCKNKHLANPDSGKLPPVGPNKKIVNYI